MVTKSEIPTITARIETEYSVSLDLLLDTLTNWRKYRAVDISPAYQRPLCWSLELSQRYIEAVLKGNATPPIIWNRNSHNSVELLDGKQRLNALFLFLEDRLKVFTSGEIKAHPAGIRYNDLSTHTYFASVRFGFTTLNREHALRYYIELNEGRVPHTEKDLSLVKDLLQIEEHCNGANNNANQPLHNAVSTLVQPEFQPAVLSALSAVEAADGDEAVLYKCILTHKKVLSVALEYNDDSRIRLRSDILVKGAYACVTEINQAWAAIDTVFRTAVLDEYLGRSRGVRILLELLEIDYARE